MIKGFFLGLVFLFPVIGFAHEKPLQPILLFSIPKGGTHLVQKCISLLTGKESKSIGLDLTDPKSKLYKDYFSSKHFHGQFAQIPYDRNWKVILNIRDLRDVIISFKNRSFSPATVSNSYWNTLNNLQKISYFIDSYDGVFSVLKQTRGYLTALQCNPDALVVKFENLVGPSGGGSLDLQKMEIKKIADYLGIRIQEKETTRIAGQLFGNTSTFKKGQIGLWKKEFILEHKERFKAKYGSYLIELGYEEDNNW